MLPARGVLLLNQLRKHTGLVDRHAAICERLKKCGYSSEHRIRLYGEDLQLVSNPVADEVGYSVLAVTIKAGNFKHVRIPLSLVSMLERQLESRRGQRKSLLNCMSSGL